MNTSNYLYIPLEIYRRELKGMMLFAIEAAKLGWQVVLGGKKVLFPLLSRMPEGVVLLKSIVPGELVVQQQLLAQGHQLISLDAEGLLPSNGRSGVELRYGTKTIAHAKLLFFWGQDQFEQVKQVFPEVAENGVVTGSPVFDYWRYLKFTSPAASKKCRTILIATSFPYPNHFIERNMSYQAVRAASGKDASDNHLEEIFLDGELQDLMYPRYQIFIKNIIEQHSDCRIILRPHPGENPAPWQALADQYSQVEMSIGGEISPLLVACDVLVHFNSTTAIEANYYEKTVLTLVPELPPKLQARLNQHALKASLVAKSEAEAMTYLSQAIHSSAAASAYSLKQIIHDCDSAKITASCQNILQSLREIVWPRPQRLLPNTLTLRCNPQLLQAWLRLRKQWLIGWADHLTGCFSGKYATSRNMFKYGKSKQGHLDMKQLTLDFNSACSKLGIAEESLLLRPLKAGMFMVKSRVRMQRSNKDSSVKE